MEFDSLESIRDYLTGLGAEVTDGRLNIGNWLGIVNLQPANVASEKATLETLNAIRVALMIKVAVALRSK